MDGKVLPRWQYVALIAVSLLTLGLLAYNASITRSGFATQDAQTALVNRQDCARRVNAEQATIKDRENLLFKTMVLAAFDNDDVAYARLRLEYGTALQAVADLEPLDKAVNRECPDA